MSNFTEENFDDLQLKCISKMKEARNDVKDFFELKKNIISNLSYQLNEVDNYIQKDNKKSNEFPMDKIFNKIHSRNKEIKKMIEEEKDEIVNKVLNEYKMITGISVERIDNKTMKIIFNFTKKEDEFYIILYFEKECFIVKKIVPEKIKLEKYLNNNQDSIQNLTFFLVKLINYDIIPLLN